jgi:hypothetical protein
MTAKALTYAALGVREYWVVNTQTLVTGVHRQPSAQGFGHLVDIASSESLGAAVRPFDCGKAR